MGHEVYAGTWEIAGKSGMNKSIARFPDVCMSPPSPPAGPIPVPYPDTSFSSDLKEGSQTVKLGGQPAALAQQSYYKPSVLGDEAATRTFGANIITHVITGKTYFQAWSMDVKIEGKNVCRHFDITTSNHASAVTTTGPNASIEAATLAKFKTNQCPCCDGPLHDNQRNGDPMTEEEWYSTDDASIKKLQDDANAAQKSLASLQNLAKTHASNPAVLKSINSKISDAQEKWDKAYEAHYKRVELKEKLARARDLGCKNVPQTPNKDCGLYVALRKHPTDPTKIDPHTKQPESIDVKAPWDTGGRAAFVRWYNTKNPTRAISPPAGGAEGQTIHHSTPVAGGGCPLGGSPTNDYANVVPDQDLSQECKDIDNDILQDAQADAKKRHLIP